MTSGHMPEPRDHCHDPELYARRAGRAYLAMLRGFRRRSGVYRYDEGPRLIHHQAQLWPFSRALAATIDLAGVRTSAALGVDVEAELEHHLHILERYWDPSGPAGAYRSDPEWRGDRYYDDNAWVGLALVELERLRPGSGWLERASELFRFAGHGWDPSGGGVFWVEQGRGTGRRNHDRNTVSTANNAALGLHLGELGARTGGSPSPEDMYEWVLSTLDASRDTDAPGTGLFWDKVRGDGTIDQTLWSYNQGAMIGVSVLLARRDGDRYLRCAESIARKALGHFGQGLDGQPAAFNAIFFRNLLALHAATGDEALRAAILERTRAYADAAWVQARDDDGLFHLAGRPTLLDQSAIVQVLALLAWDPGRYDQLA